MMLQQNAVPTGPRGRRLTSARLDQITGPVVRSATFGSADDLGLSRKQTPDSAFIRQRLSVPTSAHMCKRLQKMMDFAHASPTMWKICILAGRLGTVHAKLVGTRDLGEKAEDSQQISDANRCSALSHGAC
jgi:hypothetical protein